MNPLFQVSDDATVSDVTGYLSLLVYQSRAVQSALHELASQKQDILDNFKDIGGLIAQNEANLEQILQLTEFLEGKKLEVVKP